jgi:hypothetical protein
MENQGNISSLMQSSKSALDERFKSGGVFGIPNGDAKGYALIATKTIFAWPIAKFVQLFVWQGKIFDNANGFLINKLSPFGIHAVRGRLCKGVSRFDGAECIILDYSKTSLLAFWIRDELRQIEHPLYLGKVYVGSISLFHFTLEFPEN